MEWKKEKKRKGKKEVSTLKVYGKQVMCRMRDDRPRSNHLYYRKPKRSLCYWLAC
jgi:hypothetical protein